MYLNCHSYFSFRYGTLSPVQLLEDAERFGFTSVVLTDINSTSGCLEFIREAPKYNVTPVVGIDFRQGARQHYVGIATGNEGFFELNRHLSDVLCGKRALSDTAPEFQHCYVLYPFGSISPPLLREYEYIGICPKELNKLVFSDYKNYLHKLVAFCPVTFRIKKDFNAHRLLRAIDNNTLLSKLNAGEQADETDIMHPPEVIKKTYSRFPLLIKNAEHILSGCSISFEFGTNKNKISFTGSVAGDQELMRSKCLEGLARRYCNPAPSVYRRLEYEIEAIFKMNFISYFLINWDIVKYARYKNYFYVGRGSGANSLAAYCLNITDVDPIELDLYFERFINPYRTNPPDFDIDFSWKDREDITRYIFETHKEENTALLATYNTFQSNSIIRELGKIFGLQEGEIEELSDNKSARLSTDHISKLVIKYSEYIHDFPSHLSIHAGGILISEKPIHCYTATSLPPKGYPLTHFSMIEAEDIGLYKFDILSQRGLGHIKDTIDIIRQNKNQDIDIHAISTFKEDEKIKALLRTGKTMGCFYVESPSMRMLLRKLETDTYPGLVAASSIIRPGVAQSGMMREYILRFRQPERRKYIHPKMEELMSETYGIMVYQEDVLKVVHYFAGLTLAQADVMRRGMSGKFRSRSEFQKAKEVFFSNCKTKGYADEVTAEVWRQIESFAGYSFSKGHSASYAVESYQSLYLKAHYPREFMVGVINNFGGFYRTENYIHEARMSGAAILAPCVNQSGYLTAITGDDIYLGFIHIGELKQQTGEHIIAERLANGLFLSLEDFIKRVGLSVEQLRILVRIGAFRFSGKTKKELLWEIVALMGSQRKTSPEKELFETPGRSFHLPKLHDHFYDDAMDEIEILGFPLCSPFSLLKNPPASGLKALQLIAYKDSMITINGYYVHHKITRTKKGLLMSFGTFLDSDGYFFDTTHFPQQLSDFPFRGRGCYTIIGKVVEEFGFPCIEVLSMEKLAMLERD
ncbi:MAG: DNA polymerase III subunit alpha [Crocinitomicaceae bacterium]|nr:DNA polymerase III subunit alpha [Crocinitomicaceae bacterium]